MLYPQRRTQTIRREFHQGWDRVHLNFARMVVVIAVMAMAGVCNSKAQTAVVQLQPLVETSARRLSLAQEVAFSKWQTGTVIEDPPREDHVIASAVSEGKTEGLDPAIVSQFFRAQIEANKSRSVLAAFRLA
jgi:chorismate mutase